MATFAGCAGSWHGPGHASLITGPQLQRPPRQHSHAACCQGREAAGQPADRARDAAARARQGCARGRAAGCRVAYTRIGSGERRAVSTVCKARHYYYLNIITTIQ